VNEKLSAMDFFSFLILICPDFPKSLFKKINIIYQLIYNTNEPLINYATFDNKIFIFEFFVVFALYFYYLEFFLAVEKSFRLESFFSELQKISKNGVVDLNKDLNKEFIKNFNKDFQKDLKELSNDPKFFLLFPQEDLLEILISIDDKMLNEYDLNVVNFIEDAKDIIEKFTQINSGNSQVSFNNFHLRNKSENQNLSCTGFYFVKFYDRCLKNFNLIEDFFMEIDESANDFYNFMKKL